MSDLSSPPTENEITDHSPSSNKIEETNHDDSSPVENEEAGTTNDQNNYSPESEKKSDDESDTKGADVDDYEAVFGDIQSSDGESADEHEEQEVESDYEQEAKKNLQKIVAKKKRQTKKEKGGEPPKKRRKLADKENDRAAKKRAAEEKKIEEKLKIVRSVMDKMREAYDADLLNMETNRPAIKKLRLLTEIERTVSSTNLQKQFIDCHVLDEFGKWMKPLPDKSLPDLQIRRVILRVLSKLNISNISLEILKDSGVGKFVHLYSIHPKETRENKELAERILSSWLDR